MNIAPRFEKKLDHAHLPSGVPRGALKVTVRSVVERLTVSMISGGTGIRARSQQHSGDFHPITGCGDM